MFCRNCGKEIVDGARVCGYCGAQLSQEVTPQGNVNQMPYGGQGQGYGAQGYGGGQNYQQYPAQKSKIAAGLLGLFLGLGIYNFYLGYTKKAVIQLVGYIVAVCTAAFGVGFIILFAILIWQLVESIMIFCGKINTDGKGIPLK